MIRETRVNSVVDAQIADQELEEKKEKEVLTDFLDNQ